MILSKAATETAFKTLIKALDDEAMALREIGQNVAANGSIMSESAAGVLALAGERARFRDHIVYLESLWREERPLGIKRLPVIRRDDPANQPIRNPPLAKKVPGLSLPEAAEALGVTPKRLLLWIKNENIHAFPQGSGRWKISRNELARFCRESRDLLIAARDRKRAL